ncbi:ferritin-like domain-containing protein [Jannaschia formosa]|uniref:ferritin-like domain-containing protein n=1 Tax=Jannaschia formosa TaxID=2259592 RepID=UPI000E1C1302|nr:PA2169 family four-helix-bundle protein [Jannaschia formosa]TFL18093.1 PA2169 family four-helix-bundle protein [Jannaschia formosa]
MASEVKALETLTDTAIDSAKGYETAAETAKSTHLKTVLKEQAAKRRQLVADLNAEIQRLGGSPRTSGSTAGAAHRVWTAITDAFSSGDEEAAERVEEGEDYIEKKFRKALDEMTFDPRTREVLVRAHAQIAEGERLTDRLEDQYD